MISKCTFKNLTTNELFDYYNNDASEAVAWENISRYAHLCKIHIHILCIHNFGERMDSCQS